MFQAKIQPNIPSRFGEEQWSSWIFDLTQVYNAEIQKSGHAPFQIWEL